MGGKFMTLKACPSCAGTRLRKESLWFRVAGENIADLSRMDLDALHEWFKTVDKNWHRSKNDLKGYTQGNQ